VLISGPLVHSSELTLELFDVLQPVTTGSAWADRGRVRSKYFHTRSVDVVHTTKIWIRTPVVSAAQRGNDPETGETGCPKR
jgi:hypothetical protein